MHYLYVIRIYIFYQYCCQYCPNISGAVKKKLFITLDYRSRPRPIGKHVCTEDVMEVCVGALLY